MLRPQRAGFLRTRVPCADHSSGAELTCQGDVEQTSRDVRQTATHSHNRVGGMLPLSDGIICNTRLQMPMCTNMTL